MSDIIEITPGSQDWPAALNDLQNPPEKLWARGEVGLLQKGGVALIGSRSATSYGKHVAAGLAQQAAESGLTTISGGAIGVDAEAHRGALVAGGSTVAVLAGGLENLYPVANKQLFEAILERGGVLISEYEPATPVSRQRFLRRNELIAALATKGTIAVEATQQSGSMSTVNRAEAMGRPVYAVPGAVTSAQSSGTNRLIADGRAKMITGRSTITQLV